MTDKMRKEFASWYLEEVSNSYGESVRAQAQKNLDWAREDGSFADPMLRLACLAWEASRAVLVIARPEECEFAEPDGPYHRGYRQGVRNMVDSVEAAGLKVKA